MEIAHIKQNILILVNFNNGLLLKMTLIFYLYHKLNTQRYSHLQ
jgi:hypothetical protein